MNAIISTNETLVAVKTQLKSLNDTRKTSVSDLIKAIVIEAKQHKETYNGLSMRDAKKLVCENIDTRTLNEHTKRAINVASKIITEDIKVKGSVLSLTQLEQLLKFNKQVIHRELPMSLEDEEYLEEFKALIDSAKVAKETKIFSAKVAREVK